MKNEYVNKQLQLLEEADDETILARFRELVGETGATDFGKRFLRRRVAYAIQSAASGEALSESELQAIDFLATKDWRCNPSLKRVKPTDKKPMRGTFYVKRYKGKEYRMEVDSLGRFIYEGQPYKSATCVARMITGTHINGKTWWGITTKGDASQ